MTRDDTATVAATLSHDEQLQRDVERMLAGGSLAPLPRIEHVRYLHAVIIGLDHALVESRELNADLIAVVAALTTPPQTPTPERTPS